MEAAPYFADVADGPDLARAFWLHTDDSIRIRVVHWPLDQGNIENGTVLIFPGRTECAEKYGRAAVDLAARGFGSVAIDWRGQGLADRLLDDPLSGHVNRFSDYQLDVGAVLAWAMAENIPQPWYLLGHSMGGAIGLEALNAGLPVKAAAFSAPMWGIKISPILRPAAEVVSRASGTFGYSHAYVPGTGPEPYLLSFDFDENMLTTDRDMWEYMKYQVATHPELGLGGPSLGWLRESLRACRKLVAAPPPSVPALIFFGDLEKIVETSAIYRRVKDWHGSRLEIVKNAEHEVLMEDIATRKSIFDQTAGFFSAIL